ncbi:MAG: YHS domain-containing protein, partial [Deltaproteobacteria bacterium]|nr:YHS domain-containing protein [Nannocystaceae bacterium]
MIHPVTEAEPARAVDPVCGMSVTLANAKHRADTDGRTEVFCSSRCRERFIADPQAFPPRVAKAEAPGVAAGVVAHAHAHGAGPGSWTCPMHPEIVRERQGSCPICGMALEPMTVSREQPVDEELVMMTRRLWVAASLAIPVVVLAMVHGLLPGASSIAIQAALGTPVVLWGAAPFFARGWASLVQRSPNMFTLIALGIGVAWSSSIVVAGLAWLRPESIPAAYRGHDGAPVVYFEAAAAITALVLLGQVLELRAR